MPKIEDIKKNDSIKPKLHGSLTADQIKDLSVFLSEKFGRVQCEFCENDAWEIMRQLVSPIVLAVDEMGGVTPNLSLVTPSVGVSCRGCGNTKILKLDTLGFKLLPDLPSGGRNE